MHRWAKGRSAGFAREGKRVFTFWVAIVYRYLYRGRIIRRCIRRRVRLPCNSEPRAGKHDAKHSRCADPSADKLRRAAVFSVGRAQQHDRRNSIPVSLCSTVPCYGTSSITLQAPRLLQMSFGRGCAAVPAQPDGTYPPAFDLRRRANEHDTAYQQHHGIGTGAPLHQS